MTQKNPPSIDELEAMLRMRERLDDAFEAYILRASEAELDELLLTAGIDPATAQDRVLASISEAARRLDEPTRLAALEGFRHNPIAEPARSEETTTDATDHQIVQRKPETVLYGLDALRTSQIRTVPFKPKATVNQSATPAKSPPGGRRNERARQNELALSLAKEGSQQHGQPRFEDDSFIDTVEINGRQFSAYRDRTPAGEILLVGEFDQAWTFLEAGKSSWPLRPTEHENTRRCEDLGKSRFKRLLAAQASGEARLQFGSKFHDQA